MDDSPPQGKQPMPSPLSISSLSLCVSLCLSLIYLYIHDLFIGCLVYISHAFSATGNRERERKRVIQTTKFCRERRSRHKEERENSTLTFVFLFSFPSFYITRGTFYLLRPTRMVHLNRLPINARHVVLRQLVMTCTLLISLIYNI